MSANSCRLARGISLATTASQTCFGDKIPLPDAVWGPVKKITTTWNKSKCPRDALYTPPTLWTLPALVMPGMLVWTNPLDPRLRPLGSLPCGSFGIGASSKPSTISLFHFPSLHPSEPPSFPHSFFPSCIRPLPSQMSDPTDSLKPLPSPSGFFPLQPPQTPHAGGRKAAADRLPVGPGVRGMKWEKSLFGTGGTAV